MSALGTAVRELRIHLCQKSATSKGVREWVEKHYVPLKKANEKLPILIRECSGVNPKIYARYAMGNESSKSVGNMTAEQVNQQIVTLAKG